MDLQLWDLPNFADIPDPRTIGDVYTTGVLASLNAARARDGTVSAEQREWRVNLATNYSFDDDSSLKGFAVGGAVSYQSKVAVGYPLFFDETGSQIPVVESPYFGPEEVNGDLWFSYNRRLNDKLHWKIQLNILNAFGDNSPIPVLINPDGALAVIRNPKPREFFITNTISF